MNGFPVGILTRSGQALLPIELMEHGMWPTPSMSTTTSAAALAARHIVQILSAAHKMRLFSLRVFCSKKTMPLRDRNTRLKTTILVFADGRVVSPGEIPVEMVSAEALLIPAYRIPFVPDSYAADMAGECANGVRSGGQTTTVKHGRGY